MKLIVYSNYSFKPSFSQKPFLSFPISIHLQSQTQKKIHCCLLYLLAFPPKHIQLPCTSGSCTSCSLCLVYFPFRYLHYPYSICGSFQKSLHQNLFIKICGSSSKISPLIPASFPPQTTLSCLLHPATIVYIYLCVSLCLPPPTRMSAL